VLGPLPLGIINSTLVWARKPTSPGRSIFDWGDITLPRVEACCAMAGVVEGVIVCAAAWVIVSSAHPTTRAATNKLRAREIFLAC